MPRKWDRHSILAEINRRGETFVSLEERYGLPPSSLAVALTRPFPKAEKVISDFLGVSVKALFAYRNSPTRKKRTFRRKKNSRIPRVVESQKCTTKSGMEAVA